MFPRNTNQLEAVLQKNNSNGINLYNKSYWFINSKLFGLQLASTPVCSKQFASKKCAFKEYTSLYSRKNSPRLPA